MFSLRLSLKKSALRGAAVLPLVLLGGCEGEGPNGPEIAYKDYSAAYEEVVCEWRVKCNLEVDAEACRDSLFIDRDDTYTSAAVEAGTIAYHGDAAYACVEEIRERGCLIGEEPAPSCADVFVGTVAPEDLCMVSDECVEDGVCGFDPTCVDECCAGACRLLPGPAEIGESCANQNVECVEGAYCLRDPMTFQRTVCGAKAPVGTPCDDGLTECVDDGYCDFNNGSCALRLGEGEVCQGGDSCQAGLICDWADENYDYEEPRHCLAQRGLGLLGEACEPNLGKWGCAEYGVTCSQAGLCVLQPGPGEPCIDWECAAYAQCSDEQTGCVSLALEGQSCGWDQEYNNYVECAGDLVCLGEGDFDSKCVEPAYSADTCEVPGTPFESADSAGS